MKKSQKVDDTWQQEAELAAKDLEVEMAAWYATKGQGDALNAGDSSALNITSQNSPKEGE
jgi:hypothetical protein